MWFSIKSKEFRCLVLVLLFSLVCASPVPNEDEEIESQTNVENLTEENVESSTEHESVENKNTDKPDVVTSTEKIEIKIEESRVPDEISSTEDSIFSSTENSIFSSTASTTLKAESRSLEEEITHEFQGPLKNPIKKEIRSKNVDKAIEEEQEENTPPQKGSDSSFYSIRDFYRRRRQKAMADLTDNRTKVAKNQTASEILLQRIKETKEQQEKSYFDPSSDNGDNTTGFKRKRLVRVRPKFHELNAGSVDGSNLVNIFSLKDETV